MERTIGIAVILILFISCTKDPNTVIDEHLGSYSCKEIVYSIEADTAGNLVSHIDTSETNVIINVENWERNNYRVSGPNLSFFTNYFYNGKYSASCPNGPCPTLEFYAADSILVTMKIANPLSKKYIGKKQ